MTVFGRISRFITPPPKHSSSTSTPPPRPKSWGDKQPVDREELLPALKALLKAEPNDRDSIQLCLKTLDRIAAQSSSYLTASEIRKAMDRLPEDSDEARSANRVRAYEAAAKYHMQHIQHELHAIEALNRPLGPRVYNDYCRELVDCYFDAGYARRAIETLIVLGEDLLQKAVHSSTLKEQYLNLAIESIQVSIDLSGEKLEKDTEETNIAYRLYKKGEGPPPPKKTPYEMIDQELITYLEGLKDCYQRVRAGMMQYTGQPTLPSYEPEHLKDINLVRQEVVYLKGLLEATQNGGCRGFAGKLKNIIGGLCNRVQPGAGAEFILAAANDIEGKADLELRVHLLSLAYKRYEKAAKCYSKADDKAGFERVKQKVASMKTEVNAAHRQQHPQQNDDSRF